MALYKIPTQENTHLKRKLRCKCNCAEDIIKNNTCLEYNKLHPYFVIIIMENNDIELYVLKFTSAVTYINQNCKSRAIADLYYYN